MFRQPRFLVEIFIIANLAFLTADVYIAHAVNAFERPQEWIPIGFSAVVPLLLILALLLRNRFGRFLGFAVGWASIAVGIGGMVFHLESHFFEEQTIRNLVYAAPFVAPLAYAGLGLLLILDRMVDADSIEWAQWIIFLALGGFAGNFVLSLTDHAQNGFFNRLEWVPVGSAALAVGFLLMIVVRPLDLRLQRAVWWVLLLQFFVGALGFALHLYSDFGRIGRNLWEKLLYGAPAFAPLLFANLAVLAGVGVWAIQRKTSRLTTPLP